MIETHHLPVEGWDPILTVTRGMPTGPWPKPLASVWEPSLTEWLGNLPPVWKEAWSLALATGMDRSKPRLDRTEPLWSLFKASWQEHPHDGQRFAWSVGSRAYMPALESLVDGGLIGVNDLCKPCAEGPPLRLAEKVESKHPAVFAWLVKHGEPAEVPWVGGRMTLRDKMHRYPHKKMAQVWLSRPEETSPEQLGKWLITLWTHGKNPEIQAMVWNAWDQRLKETPLTERDEISAKTAQDWSHQVLVNNGWPPFDSFDLMTKISQEAMAKACWERWHMHLGDSFLAQWHRLLLERYAQVQTPPFTLNPTFEVWFNGHVSDAFRRQEQKQLRLATDGVVNPIAIAPPVTRRRL